MPDLPYDLSRRRLLGGAATIGGAAALGGTGTMAFFSDEETFANNKLVAGELDLKVDWEEHYSDWSDDESEGLQNPVLMPGDDIPDEYVGLPFCAASPSVFVHSADLATFMDNTSIEAMPDSNNDGIQEELAQFDICGLPWDTPEILDPEGPRTDNDDTRLDDGSPAPLINLHDVKPGDFGELTLSFHLCDNPGYVWLTGQLTENAENGLTEPESKDPDENGGEPGELAQALRACVWYDENCDNTVISGETECILATDTSESIASNNLPGAPAGVNGEPGDATRLEAIKAAIGDFDGPGFLSQLANSCQGDVEIGAVGFSENLEHLDNDDDGDDADDPAGNDADNEDANLDKALMPVGAANQEFPVEDNDNAGTDNGGATEYEELKLLFGGGTEFDEGDEFVVDDRSAGDPFAGANRYEPSIDGNDDYVLGNDNDTFVAERPYTGDGDSTQDDGIVKAIQALLPGGTTHEWIAGPGQIRGIDPSGNAAPPGAARKTVVYLTDGAFSGVGEDDPHPVFEDPGDASDVSASAANLGIDIKPILVNENPSANDVTFAENMATPGEEPTFVNRYDDSVSPPCSDSVTDAGYSCTSMVSAMQSVRTQICAATGGDEEVVFDGKLVDLLAQLTQGAGIPLDGSPSTPFDELGGDPSDPNRGCFAGSSTNCLGIEWWLPVDHANEIQTDSIGFDLGFYTEQCRHNDGSGQALEDSDDGDSGGVDSFNYTFKGDDDVVGSSLEGIEVKYPDGSGAVSNASVDSVSLAGQNVSDDLLGTTTSNNDDTLTLVFGGSYSIDAGDELALSLSGVKEPSSPYDVFIVTKTVMVNPQDGQTSFSYTF